MSEFNQISFRGGMNLIYDDTRLADNEYREAFNVRNRFDVLDQIKEAKEVDFPAGNKQAILTFGDYVLVFIGGSAYYQHYTSVGWTMIDGFSMDHLVPRFYTVMVPVNTTYYGRYGVPVASIDTAPTQFPGGSTDSGAGVISVESEGRSGNLSGLLVQDGKNQPQFIYIGPDRVPTARVTQKYSDWYYDPTGLHDRREYVPIGTYMEWYNGILFIVSVDGEAIYRSVSGRPLDFVVNVDIHGNKGGDATTTSYSVGVGGITCLKALNDGSLFVSCRAGVCFAVTLNQTPGARTLFGEYTFNRRVLFNAVCLSDRAIVDILGDTAFIDVDGLRSYNAVMQFQNEGRNSIFSLKVASLFQQTNVVTREKSTIIQSADSCAAIVYDNYALFAVNTIYGNAIIVYDTLNQCYSSIDLQTTTAIRQFAKIDIGTMRLYCITSDNKVLQLYGGTNFSTSTFRMQSLCAGTLQGGANVRLQVPKMEIKLNEVRCILSRFSQDSTVSLECFVNNRLSVPTMMKYISYIAPTVPYSGSPIFSDVDTGLENMLFSITNCGQGWKVSVVLSWTGGGSITNIAAVMEDLVPMSPLRAQANQMVS